MKDFPVKSLYFTIGTRVVYAGEDFDDAEGLAHPWKNFDANFEPFSERISVEMQYRKTHISTKSLAMARASIFTNGTACVSFVKRSTMTRRKRFPFLDFVNGPRM